MASTVASALNERSIIIGFSMGAIVAAELARQNPEKVMALALVAFNATADLPERSAVRPGQQEQVRKGGLERIVAKELKPNYLADQNRSDEALLQIVMSMAHALGPERFIAQSEALRLRADLTGALPDFRMPVLLACGAEDRLCPPEWHCDWAGLIGQNARLVIIPGAGHLVPLEQPDILADNILDWIAESENAC
jgi:pimeloyl-ACP methyl ester carboxylesterase